MGYLLLQIIQNLPFARRDLVQTLRLARTALSIGMKISVVQRSAVLRPSVVVAAARGADHVRRGIIVRAAKLVPMPVALSKRAHAMVPPVLPARLARAPVRARLRCAWRIWNELRATCSNRCGVRSGCAATAPDAWVADGDDSSSCTPAATSRGSESLRAAPPAATGAQYSGDEPALAAAKPTG